MRSAPNLTQRAKSSVTCSPLHPHQEHAVGLTSGLVDTILVRSVVWGMSVVGYEGGGHAPGDTLLVMSFVWGMSVVDTLLVRSVV